MKLPHPHMTRLQTLWSSNTLMKIFSVFLPPWSSSLPQTHFTVMLSSGRSESRFKGLALDIHYILEDYFSTLQLFCQENQHVDCYHTFPIGLKACGVIFFTKFVFIALFGSIVLQEKLFTYDCLLKCFSHKSMSVRRREEEELVNQMIHGEGNIRHQQEKSFVFFPLVCVSVFFLSSFF